MKKISLLLVAITCALVSYAQISVAVTNPTNTTPNLSASYTSLANALAALNATTAMSGPVTLTLAAGAETAPATGLTIGSATLNAVLSATNTITIIKGVGTVTLNAGVGTATPASAAPDGILKLTGADYITIDGLTFTDANTTNPATMEYGIGLFKLNAGDGCNNNTIRNCFFNMQRVNNAASAGPMFEGSVGIAAMNSTATAAVTALTPTNGGTLASNGTNSGNKFYSNTFNGGNIGIGLSGYAATAGIGPAPVSTTFLGDLGNDIGGNSVATGNTVLNFGGGNNTSASAGIRGNYQWSLNIQYNNINNNNGSGVNHAAIVRGIYAQNGASANVTISNNTVTINSGATTVGAYGIDNGMGAAALGNTVNINNNLIQNCTYTTATTGTFYGISTAATAATVNTNSNQVINNTIGLAGTVGSATFYGIYNQSSSTNFNANFNTISGNVMANNSGSIYCIRGSTSTITVDGNTMSNNSIPNNTLATSSLIYGYYNISSPVLETVTNNNINNFSINGSGTSTSNLIHGIYNVTASGAKTFSGNNINNLTYTSSGTGSATVIGIRNPYTLTSEIFKNVIHTLSSTGTTPTVSGILLGSTTATTFNCYNNLIGNLSTPQSTGFNLTGILCGTVGANINLYYNTIYLNATSTGTGFASSAIFMSSTTPSVTMINNILVNLSTSTGTGLSTAVRRSSAVLTSYNLASNNNLFYTGTPSAANPLYFDGTNAYQTLLAYKTAVAPRENSSVTEAVSSTPGIFFQSLTGPATGTATNFLHLVNGLSTQAESGGIPVAGITDDFDGNVRNVSNPDIGADEFTGTYVDGVGPTITYTELAGACNNANRTLSGVIINDISGVPTTGNLVPRIYYRKNSGTWFSQPGTLTAGTGTNGTWSFTILVADMGGVVIGDVVSYYVIAQDISSTPNISSNPDGVVATNVNTVTTHPTAYSYIVSGSLSGTYTVGVGGTFQTLTAAVAAYNAGCGLSGPVVFNLIDPTYPSETFPITINQNSNSSVTNTLTIKPAANTTISGSVSNGQLIRVLGNNVIIDGSNNGTTSRNLTITNTSTTSPSVILFGSVGTVPILNSGIKNCIIINGTNSSSAVVVGDAPSGVAVGGYFNNLFIQNNSVQQASFGIYSFAIAAAGNGSMMIAQNDLNTSGTSAIRLVGIYTQGTEGATITGNKIGNISNTIDAANLTGIWLATGVTNSTVSGNTISNISGTLTAPRGIFNSSGILAGGNIISNNLINGLSSTSSAITHGIYVLGATGGLNIQRNVLYDIKNTGTGAAYGFTLASSGVNNNINVSNNMISDVAAAGSATVNSNGHGIFISAGSGYSLYYNSVHMNTDQTSAASITSAINITSGITAAGAINLSGNIFANSQTVGTNRYAIYSGAANTVYASINFNNYSTTGPNLGYIGSARVDLPAIIAGFGGNVNSTNVVPVFMSPINLHLNPGFNNSLNNTVTVAPLGGIVSDIDGDAKGNPNDVGADEFVPCTTPATATASSNTPVCAGTSLNLIGTSNGTSFLWTGPNGFTSTLQNPVIANATPAAAGTYYFQAFLNGCPSLPSAITVVINNAPLITSVTASNTSICTGGTTDLMVVASSNMPGTTLLSEGFEAGLPAGWVSLNGGTGNVWTVPTSPTGAARTGTRAAEYLYNLTNDANAYLISSGVALTSGVTYTISSWYRTSASFPEKLKITVGTAQTVAAQNTVLQDLGTIQTSTYTQQSITYTPTTTGTYYFGWNAYSTLNQYYIDLDDVSISAPAVAPTYSWTSSPAGFTSNQQNPTGVSPTVNTTYTVTVTNSMGCSTSGSVSVAINNPDVVSTPATQTICSGVSITPIVLTSTAVGTTYTWTRNNPGVTGTIGNSGSGSTISGTLINSTTTPVTVTFTIIPENGGCTGTGVYTASVTVNPSSTITLTSAAGTNAQTVCSNSPITNITYNTTGATGATFSGLPIGVTGTWSANAVTISGTPTALSGVSNYTITLTGGCGSVSANGSITVNAKPILTSTSVQPSTCASVDGSIDLTVTGPAGPYTYVWTGAGVNPGTEDQSGLAAGTYTVTVSAANTCTSTITIILNGPGGCGLCPTIGSFASTPISVSCSGSSITLTASGLTNMGSTYGIIFKQSLTALANPYVGGTTIATVSNAALTSGGTVAATSATLAAGSYFIYTIITPSPLDITCRPSAMINHTVNITPTVDQPLPLTQTVCAGAATTAVSFTGTGAGIYTWTNSTPSIGLAASGTGNVASFTAVNAGLTPVTATITVTPSTTSGGLTCTGSSKTFTIIVNPIPVVNQPASQSVCAGAPITAVNFTGTGADVFTWTNNTPSIGLAASGTGNIASFTATNPGSTALVATITVTPSSTNGGLNCSGTPKTFTISVNPAATVNPTNSQVVCATNPTTAVTFTGTTNTVFNWTNSNTAIGLGASGTGNIPSFTATNTGNAPITGTVTVTPNFAGAGSTTTTFSNAGVIEVPATPTTIGSANPYPSNIVVSGVSGPISKLTVSLTNMNHTFPADIDILLVGPGGQNVVIMSDAGGSFDLVGTNLTFDDAATANLTTAAITSGTYQPTNLGTTADNFDAPAPVVTTPIGNVPLSIFNGTTANGTWSLYIMDDASGDFGSFDGGWALNITAAAATACTGAPNTFTYTVNPTPRINAVTNQVTCNNATTAAVNFTSPTSGGTLVYSWTNTNTSIGLGAAGTGNIPAFTAVNTGTAPVTATITVQAAYTNAGVTCSSVSSTFTITVNPTPTVAPTVSQTVCVGTMTAPVTFTGTVPGTVYTWTNSNAAIGLPATGTGNIAAFTATNTTNAPITATITVTPTIGSNNCPGTASTFTITVNPALTITCPANVTTSGTLGSCTAIVNYTPTITGSPAPTVTYAFTGATIANGTGSGSGSTFNAGVTTVTLTVTNTCGTRTCSFTVTVNDAQPPVITAQPANRTVCEGSTATFSVTATSAVSYQWERYNGTTWVPVTGATAATLTLTNVTTAMNSNTYRVVVRGLCTSVTSGTATLTITAAPTVTIISSQTLLVPGSGFTLTAITSQAGGTFIWFKNGVVVPGVIGNTLGGGRIDDRASYRVTYTTPNGCTSTSADFVVGTLPGTEIFVYPNPSRGQFQIRYFNQANAQATVYIYDNVGQIVYRKQMPTGAMAYSRLDVNISNMAAGIYVIKLIDASGKEIGVKRVVKQ